VPPLVLDEALARLVAEPAEKDVVQPVAVLTLLERVGVQQALEPTIEEDALDVGLGDERPHQRPGPRQVQIPLARDLELPALAVAVVEAEVDVTPAWCDL